MPKCKDYPSPEDLDVVVHIQLTCCVHFWVLVNVLIIHILLQSKQLSTLQLFQDRPIQQKDYVSLKELK